MPTSEDLPGVHFTPLKRIPNPKGDILHAMKVTETSFVGFGEAYFSTVNPGSVKGWKKHTKMTLNLVVPSGTVRFVIAIEDVRGRFRFREERLSPERYGRLTIEPGRWFAFEGLGMGPNIVLNIANIPHDSDEAENAPLDAIPWFQDVGE